MKRYIEFPGTLSGSAERMNIKDCLQTMGIASDRLGIDAGSLPFAAGDVTAGSESEMQTVVAGRKTGVDLPLTIEQSNYLSNIRRRIKSGDASEKIVTELEKYLNSGEHNIWENSWVRFPQRNLGKFARSVLDCDLRQDKTNPSSEKRTDAGRFLYDQQQETCLRIPVSYLLKLALADIMDSPHLADPLMQQTGKSCMDKFLNDNTSPETSSLHIIVADHTNSIGHGTAVEMSIRYLLGQVLIEYANQKFALRQNGQDVQMFFSPHPPVRQKRLSRCISDSFYRELFMNPCLSGWDRGEEKNAYMHLCHRVLSRSQFNAVIKLREAGIITSNLVSLPNLCNISLANNGTHVSLGSSKLSALLSDPSSGYTRQHEKYTGDLVVKIVEHFLPLFVGTYTAAPYRMGFTDFHPETALGFLPHELDYTHLRMLWRRWKKKADLNILGFGLTPFGPARIDQLISRIFSLRGDYVPDYRLLDYLVALLSTDESPALNGEIGNSGRLKRDLADLGIFDTQMSLYLFDKLREFDLMGFSGFEGRHYSLFDSFESDMAAAVNMQNLLYLLAFKYMASGKICHENIPDDPFVESERRQIVFGRAIGLPTFFVHKETRNTLLKDIMQETQGVRSSRRYGGYVRVHHREYCLALIKMLRRDAADLIEMLHLRETVDDLEFRMIDADSWAASGKITRGVLSHMGAASPMSVEAESFNAAAEDYYRTKLRGRHIEESFRLLRSALHHIRQESAKNGTSWVVNASERLNPEKGLEDFLKTMPQEMMSGKCPVDRLERIVGLIMIYVTYQERRHQNSKILFSGGQTVLHEASVY